jgi:hypothetical protein
LLVLAIITNDIAIVTNQPVDIAMAEEGLGETGEEAAVEERKFDENRVKVSLRIHPSQIPRTLTFLKRCGDAIVPAGYLDNISCTSILLVAFLNAAVDSQTA